MDRRRVLDAASDMLARGGPAALNLREAASEAGCSTMMIYTLFGGKEALIEAVYEDGFERLGAALARVRAHADPIVRLRKLAAAYRAFGLANRTVYAAMFSRPVDARNLRGAGARRGTASFSTLVEAVRTARNEGAIAGKHDPELVADALWSAVHGHVSLEVSGHFFDDEASSEARYAWLVDTYLLGLARARPTLTGGKP